MKQPRDCQVRPIRANVVVDFPGSGKIKFKARWLVYTFPTFRRGSRVVAVFATKKAALQFIAGEAKPLLTRVRKPNVH